MDTSKIKSALDDFLENKVTKLNQNHKLLICAATVLVPIVAFYFLFYSPKSESIATLSGSIARLQKDLKVAKIQADKIDEQKNLLKDIEQKFKEASVVIPDNKEIPSLLTSISSEGTAAGLDILFFKPGVEKPLGFYAEIPVSLSVHGSYHTVAHFLDTVSKLPRIVNVANMNLGSPKMHAGRMLLQSSINLVTYKFIEPTEGASKGNGRGKR